MGLSMSIPRDGQKEEYELQHIQRPLRFPLMSLPFELREQTVRSDVLKNALVVTQDIERRLRIRHFPTIATINGQLGQQALRVVFRDGIFDVQSSVTDAAFEQYLMSTIIRPSPPQAIPANDLLSNLSFLSFSDSPCLDTTTGLSTSLTLAQRCPNLRELKLNFEHDHTADFDPNSHRFFKDPDQLRNEFQLDLIFNNARLQRLRFTGSGVNEYLYGGISEVAKYFEAEYVSRGRRVEVTLVVAPMEIWAEDTW